MRRRKRSRGGRGMKEWVVMRQGGVFDDEEKQQCEKAGVFLLHKDRLGLFS
jgi:hypothetical protein